MQSDCKSEPRSAASFGSVFGHCCGRWFCPPPPLRGSTCRGTDVLKLEQKRASLAAAGMAPQFILKVELCYTLTGCCNVLFFTYACLVFILQKNAVPLRSFGPIRKEKARETAGLTHLLLSIQELLSSINRYFLESNSMIASPATTANSALLLLSNDPLMDLM